MNSSIILFCLIAVASAQWQRPSHPRQDITITILPNGQRVCRLRCNRANQRDCPPVDCPTPDKPVLNPQCPVLQCNFENSLFLFPMPDPNFFYQCQRTVNNGWETLVRPCGCETLFDYGSQRCVHPHEFRRQCNATPNPIPPARACPVECPGCGDPGLPNPTPPTPTLPNPIPPTNPPGNGCPCMPCFWWPCMPCNC